MIIIGNIISFVAALFMVASSFMGQKRMIFLCQFINCVLLAVASVFFGAYAGVTTLVISAVRNLLVAKDKYTKEIMYLLLVATVVLGFWTNTKGLMGLVPVVATVQYTACCHYLKSVKATKYSILVNVVMWLVYSAAIKDYATAASDLAVMVVGTISLVKMYRGEKKAVLESAKAAPAEEAEQPEEPKPVELP